MSRDVNSAFFLKLQGDSFQMAELIQLGTDAGRTWRWTSANEFLVSSTFQWDPFPGQPATGIEESIDLGTSIIDFVMANSADTFTSLLRGQELDNAALNIRRVFIDTPDLDAMSVFDGTLAEFTHTRNIVAGRMRSRLGGISQEWPYYTYMDQCAWRFGGDGCAIDTTLHTTSGTIWSGSGNLLMEVESGTFHVDSFEINRFEFGKFTFTGGANSGSVRAIFASSGDWMTMSHKMAFAVVSGDTFSIYPGCKKRLIEDCKSLYNNSSNFLGFPWIPRQENAF